MQKTKYTTSEQIEEMRKEIREEKEKMSGIRKPKNSGEGRPRRQLVVKTIGWVVFASVILLLVSAIVSTQLAKSRGEIPSLLGFQFFVIESGSMTPTLDIGTVILSRKPKNAQSIKENDIVTFRTSSGAVVTHRIVEIIRDEEGNVSYRTKGDNPRNTVDPEVLTPQRVLAVFISRIPLT